MSSEPITNIDQHVQRTKRKASEEPPVEIDDLVHKAKASRFAPSKPAGDDDPIEELLEQSLTCSICAEIYVDPILTLPCSHSFCGSCAARWFEGSCSCPSCRTKVTGTKPNLTATEFVDILLQKFPEKKRDEEELLALTALYTPGQEIAIFQDDYEDEDEDEDEPWVSDSNTEFNWNPCPTCDPNNNLGYHCPAPITAPATADGHRFLTHLYSGHIKCTFCDRSVPIGWKPFRCDICSDVCCGNMLECSKPNAAGWIAKAEDQTFGFNDLPGPQRPPNERRWNLFNPTEQDRLWNYIVDNGLDWEDIGSQLLQNQLLDSGNLPRAHNICKGCASNLFDTNLMKWWIWFKQNSNIDDPRVKCWYGYTCRTQTHSSDHATKLNHACEMTPPDQRSNNAPRMPRVQSRGASPPL